MMQLAAILYMKKKYLKKCTSTDIICVFSCYIETVSVIEFKTVGVLIGTGKSRLSWLKKGLRI